MSEAVTIVEITTVPEPLIIHPDALLRLPEVTKLTGFGRSAIYERMGLGTFPLAKDLGGNCVAWSAAEVLSWIKARPNVVIRPATPRSKLKARS